MQVKNKVIALFFCVGGLIAGVATSCGYPQVVSLSKELQLRKMSGFPTEEEGFGHGVSACYAGLIGEHLLVAGGCNFPEIPAAEGGTKRFYKGIYIADLTSDSILNWQKVGELPAPAAYGVTVTTPQGMICVGGTNVEGASRAVYRISLSGDKHRVKMDTLPSLPYTLDNMGGALLDQLLYVVGGNASGTPSNRLLCLNLAEPSTGWQELPAFPGDARLQPVCVGMAHAGENRLYLWGGFAPYHKDRSATLSVDGYVYSPSRRKWTPLAPPMGKDSVPISLGGGTAIALSDSIVMCMGGVNKDIFLSALQREEQMKKATTRADHPALLDSLKMATKKYMLQAPSNYRFNDRICIYNIRRNEWKELLSTPETARAGAALVGRGKRFFSISGELKPGIRTPDIVEITIR